MKFRKLIILIVIVFVLVLLVVGKSILRKKENKAQQNSAIAQVDLSHGLQKDFIQKIVFYRGEDEKNKEILVKNSLGIWVVENKFSAHVRVDIVNNLLKDMSDLKGEVRGESKAVFDDFGISNSKGVHLILLGAGDIVLKHMVFSEIKPQWNMSFARLNDSERVVLISRDILSLLGLYSKDAKVSDNYFIDFKITSLNPSDASQIELRAGSASPLVLVKKDIWSFEPQQKQEIDPVKVNEFLQSVNNLYAQDVVDPALNTYGFDKPFFSLLIKVKNDEKPLRLMVGGFVGSEKLYYVKMSDGMVYKVSEATISSIKKDKLFFLKAFVVKKN